MPSDETNPEWTEHPGGVMRYCDSRMIDDRIAMTISASMRRTSDQRLVITYMVEAEAYANGTLIRSHRQESLLDVEIGPLKVEFDKMSAHDAEVCVSQVRAALGVAAPRPRVVCPHCNESFVVSHACFVAGERLQDDSPGRPRWSENRLGAVELVDDPPAPLPAFVADMRAPDFTGCDPDVLGTGAKVTIRMSESTLASRAPKAAICTCPAASEYDPPCPRHGVLGIGVTGADETRRSALEPKARAVVEAYGSLAMLSARTTARANVVVATNALALAIEALADALVVPSVPLVEEPRPTEEHCGRDGCWLSPGHFGDCIPPNKRSQTAQGDADEGVSRELFASTEGACAMDFGPYAAKDECTMMPGPATTPRMRGPGDFPKPEGDS